MTDGVLVDRIELKGFLLQLKTIGKVREDTDAFVYSKPGLLRIQAKDVRLGIPARGDLMKVVVVNAAMLSRSHRVLGKKKQVLIQIVGNELFLGEFSISCELVSAPPRFPQPTRTTVPRLHEASPPKVQTAHPKGDALSLPRIVTDRVLLRVNAEQSKQEVELSGLATKIEKALLERNRRITLALKSLDRYGVTRKDLTRLIDESVQR